MGHGNARQDGRHKILEGNQNSATYIQLFKDFTLPLININYAGYSVVHDNCQDLSRNSKIHKVFKSERSSDLNIMENILKILSKIVYSAE